MLLDHTKLPTEPYLGLYVPKKFFKTQEIKDFLIKQISRCCLFQSYSDDEREALVDAFEVRRFYVDSVIFRQFDHAKELFVIQQGLVEVLITKQCGDVKIKTLGPGDIFGELALMSNTPRNATIRSASSCVIWSIAKDNYREIKIQCERAKFAKYLSFLQKVKIDGRELKVIMRPEELNLMVEVVI